ncbi:MAG: NlpC/P60 family protein [Acidimicrobiia bacterium]
MSSSARSRTAVAVAATLALVTAATLTTATLAQASPQTDLASQQQRATELENEIQANGNRVSVLDEDYTNAQLAIQHASAQIDADEAAVKIKAAETASVRAQLEARGAELYMGAGNPAPLAALDVSNADELGLRSQYGAAAADQDHQLLDEVTVAVEQLGLQRSTLEQARAGAIKQRDELDAARSQIIEATTQQQDLLGQVNGNIKTLVDQIQTEQQLAQEAAARVTMDRIAQQQALAAQDSPQTAGQSSTDGSAGGPSTDVPAAGPEAQVAVNTAAAQLGKPYVYAGSGPDVFDCSGLTMYAWAAAGVSLPHNALAQYDALPHVNIDQLEPGDLVFFGDPIHHVGMFVGNGTMIDAPYTGVDVRYDSIYRPDFAGAARP